MTHAPAREDPVVATVSEAIGGPIGHHARSGRRWLRPIGVLMLLAAVVFGLGMVKSTSCYQQTWTGKNTYQHFCYSDLPYLYTDRGLAEQEWPYSSDPGVRERYPQVMEYPVGISYYAWATSYATKWLARTPPDDRAAEKPADFWGLPGMQHEVQVFVIVNVLGFAALAIASTWFLARTHRRRPWDAAAFALAPVLAATGIINWDMLAVVFVAAAAWAWSRDRPLLTGILIGLGCATKLYPIFLLGAVLVICIRRRRWLDLVTATLAAGLAWILANAPALATGWEQWKVFWSFNAERGPDLGSLWLVVQQATGRTIAPDTVNLVSEVGFVLWCLGVLLVCLKAPVTPRFSQIGYLVVAGFLIVNKVYSPQYVLWLLPLAVLAVPRWRDQLIWQSGELLYFVSVWWYLAGVLRSGGGEDAPFYWIAIVLRIAAQLYLAVVIVRDMYEPAHDRVQWEAREAQAPASTSSNEVVV